MNRNKLKGIIRECGYTQADIAKILGLSVYGFRQKLNGAHEFKASEVKKLADFFGVTVDYFFSPSVAKIAIKPNDRKN